MDRNWFDDVVLAFGTRASRRAGLRAALGGLLGTAGAGMALEVESEAKGRRRRKRCNPACADGQTCVKGDCVCENGGTPCGNACCAIGQVCREGQCGAPEPPVCIPFGEVCKGVGRACCAGTVCGSGQGGRDDVACWKSAGAACERTAECVYDSQCKDGACVANEHQGGGDDGGGGVDGPYTVCASGCRYTSIADAVAKAAPGATVTIGPGSFEACNVQIDKDLTIIGAGAGPEPPLPDVPTQVPAEPPYPIQVVPPAGYDPVAANAGGTTITCPEAQGTSRGRRAERSTVVERRIFTIPAGRTVRIESVLLAFGQVVDPAGLDSQTTGMGGQILNSGTLTLRSSAFAFGKAVFGGQVANLGTLTIDGCAFVLGSANEYVQSHGGALWNAGVATVADTGSRRTAFAWNTAKFFGGAIHNAISSIGAAGSPSLTVSGAAWFAGNVAQGSGGAIATWAVPLTIEGSVDVFSNVTSVSGGGVYATCGQNQTGQVRLAGTAQIRFNSVVFSGGGLYVDGCGLEIGGTSQVRSNSARRSGGGVYKEDSGAAAPGVLKFTGAPLVTGNITRGCNFEGCTNAIGSSPKSWGGGVFHTFGGQAGTAAAGASGTIITANTKAGDSACDNYYISGSDLCPYN